MSEGEEEGFLIEEDTTWVVPEGGQSGDDATEVEEIDSGDDVGSPTIYVPK